MLRWRCVRGCGAEGAKAYGTAAEAQRYSGAFDREDRDDLGRRAPLLGLFPLRPVAGPHGTAGPAELADVRRRRRLSMKEAPMAPYAR